MAEQNDVSENLAKDKSRPDSDKKHILVVDDHFINQTIFCKILEGAGYKVSVAGNGEEACDYASQQILDAIIMDVHMPILDGAMATKRIRESGNLVPIIGCTADSEPAQIRSYLEAGMSDILVKPVNKNNLLLLINKVL